MDMGQVLTAGVTAAVVSSSVSLATSLLTLRYNRRKDRHTLFFSRLEALWHELMSIDVLDPSVNVWGSDEESLKKLGQDTALELFAAQAQIVAEAYNKYKNLFQRNRFLFTANQQSNIDTKLFKVTQLIDEFSRNHENGDYDYMRYMVNVFNCSLEYIYEVQGALRRQLQSVQL